MADNGQANDLGYITPVGTDPIKDGDDAISNNARVSADLITQANNHITDLTGHSPMSGHGNPNDAPVYGATGRLYSDLDATAGARLWFNSGIFNAPDWRVIAGDTGAQSLDVVNDWTIGEGDIRRLGNLVYFRASTINGTSATSDRFVNIPLGFRPSIRYSAFFASAGSAPSDTPTIYQVQYLPTENCLRVPLTATNGYLSVSWPTDDAWPTL